MASLATLLEVFTHPDDLEISIFESKRGRHVVLVTRGHRHSFKLLVSSPANFDTREAAVKSVRELLETARLESKKALTDFTSIEAWIMNPDKMSAEALPGLSQECVDWILQELAQGKVASTHSRSPATALHE